MLLVIILLLILSIAGNVYLWCHGQFAATKKLIRSLRQELNEVTVGQQNAHWNNEQLNCDLAFLQKERDEYKRIAETHEVKFPQHVKRRVWENRLFKDHPKQNLQALSQELTAFKDADLIVNVTFMLHGAWKAHCTWQTTTCRFTVPPERISKEIECFITDQNLSLTEYIDGVKQWKPFNSPITFSVDLTTVDSYRPEIHTVEVLRTETVVKEVVQRVIVGMNESPSEMPADTVFDDPRFAALVEIAVSQEMHRRNQHRADPVPPPQKVLAGM